MEMCWMGPEDQAKILHLRINGEWKPYHSCGSLAVADYEISGGSRGYATMQSLLKKGWKLVSTQQSLIEALGEPVSEKR